MAGKDPLLSLTSQGQLLALVLELALELVLVLVQPRHAPPQRQPPLQLHPQLELLDSF